MRRVAVTGFGIVSALGRGVSETEARLRRGECALGPLTVFDPARAPFPLVGEVKDLAVPPGLSRSTALLDVAADEALASAGLPANSPADLLLGTTLGGMEKGTAYLRRLREGRDDAEVLADFLPGCQPARLARRLGLGGRVGLLNNACTSSTDALGIGFERIASGRAERVLAGGYDPLCEFVAAGFGSLQNVSKTRCRPFDAGRDGLVLGEGAALFVLEAADAARERGAEVMALVTGYGAAADAFHMTLPGTDGFAVARSLERALARAGRNPRDLDYINLHGTGTKANDLSEYAGLREVFGDALPALACSSTKGATGHTLGAAGAVEAAFCLLALRGGFLPANVGLETIDSAFAGLSPVTEPTEGRIRAAASTSLGFGGQGSCLILERSAEGGSS